MENVPRVTGISPKEGRPRTKLTIRGENFGLNQEDIISVKICDIECLIFTEWVSSQKIITRSPHCVGTGGVIITTKSCGVGVSMIQFRAFEENVGILTPSGVWVDESELFQYDSHYSTSPALNNFNYDNSISGVFTEKNFSSMYPEGGSKNPRNDLLSDSFNPYCYLVDNHENSTFEKLKQVYHEHLRKSRSESENTLNTNTFLKANVLSIIDCLNALNSFYLAYKKDRQEVGFDMTAKIDECIKNANNEAHLIFDNIISRKDKSDSTRNALNVLQRYRFLFNLPSNIDKSMQRKDYDTVINDFFRAKNLFADSSVNVFRKVYLEVEQRIEKFSEALLESFRNYCVTIEESNIDELKKLIKYLSALEIGNDPAWEAIQLIKNTLFDKISSCRQKYLLSGNKLSINIESTDQMEAPSKVKFIDEISKLFSRIFIVLFKLGSAYLNGDLYNRDSVGESMKNKAVIFEKQVINESINLLCNEYRSVLLPDTIKSSYMTNQPDESIVIWLPYCLRCTVSCYSNLLTIDFNSVHLPNSAILKQVQSVIFDLRLHTMTCLFAQVSNEVKVLYKNESWNIQLDDIYGVRTNLPLLFETKVIDILQLVRDSVIQIRNSEEVDVFSQINVKGLVKQLAQNVINSFLSALEKSVANPISSNSNITPDNRSLIVLCNCSFTSNYVLPKLYEAFDKYGYPDMSQVIQITQRKFKELEQKLLDIFIEKKRDVVIGAIEPSMYLFDSNWTSVKEMPKDVSYYVKETILNLIFVQAEIYQINPQLVYKTMFDILLATIDEIERIYESCISKISDAARVQMLIDINAIDYVMKKTGDSYYCELKHKIDNCRAICNASIQDQTIRKLIDDVTLQFCTSMRLQISCFHFDYENIST